MSASECRVSPRLRAVTARWSVPFVVLVQSESSVPLIASSIWLMSVSVLEPGAVVQCLEAR